jgi:hypothetical protein
VTDDFVRKQVVSDPHSPRRFRVLGPTRNIDAWCASFGVQPGDAMYVAPDQRVRVRIMRCERASSGVGIFNYVRAVVGSTN